ncbi:MAG: hypothetical protein ABSC19_11880 [Syntrophorhabdales bacterium]
MEPAADYGTIVSKVAEAHELVETLKAEFFAEEEKRMTRRVVHKLLFYFLITFMAGSVAGLFYMNWQTDNRLSLAKRTGILALSDGSMFQLTPLAPRNDMAMPKR